MDPLTLKEEAQIPAAGGAEPYQLRKCLPRRWIFTLAIIPKTWSKAD